MRILKGSEVTLAPTNGYDYVCRIEIVRPMTLTAKVEQKWREVVVLMFNSLKSLKYSNGKSGNFMVI